MQQELELHKQLSSAQEKHAYFLLAAAGSAIGFTLTQTKTEALSFFHIPLGLAIVCWGLSFFTGLQFIKYRNSSTYLNFIYLQHTRKLGGLGQTAEVQKLKTIIENDFKDGTEQQGKKQGFYGLVQSTTLLLGATLYVIWHVIKMANVAV